jgi:hypothetical protein
VKLREILKHKLFDENLAFRDINNFKRANKQTQDDTILALHSLGPPSFVKTNFSSTTIKKFKKLTGKYFGC